MTEVTVKSIFNIIRIPSAIYRHFRLVLRLTAWSFGLAGVCLFFVATRMDDKNPAVVTVWKACALIAIIEFAFDSYFSIQAENDAKKQQLELDEARKDAAEAKSKSAQLESELLAAKEADRDIRERVEGERLKHAPRRLTDQQKGKLRELLSVGKRRGVMIVSRFMDAESKDFAQDFKDALESSNWEVQLRPMNLGDEIGVVVGSVPIPRVPEVEAIRNALDNASIKYDTVGLTTNDNKIGQGVQAGYAFLIIGRKPPIQALS